MSCGTIRNYDGSYCMVMYAKACPGTDHSTLTFKRFGMITESSEDDAWNKEDATGDTSPRGRMEYLVSRMETTGSFSFVSMGSDIENQKELIRHIQKPGVDTDYKPFGVIRLVDPTTIQTFDVIFDSRSASKTVSGKATGTINYTSNGAAEIIDNPNPLIAQETPAT